MTPINGTIENDLRTLKNFSEYDKLGGTHTMLWFYGLITRYPLEYLLYSHETQFHTPYREKAKATISKKFQNKILNVLNTKLNEGQVFLLNQILREL